MMMCVFNVVKSKSFSVMVTVRCPRNRSEICSRYRMRCQSDVGIITDTPCLVVGFMVLLNAKSEQVNEGAQDEICQQQEQQGAAADCGLRSCSMNQGCFLHCGAALAFSRKDNQMMVS